MPSFTLTEAKPYHCGQMIRLLRRAHKNALIALGVDQHRQLRTCFDGSAMRKAWLIDGKLAALGGVLGTQMSAAGYIWLAVSEQATDYPMALVHMVKTELNAVMQTKRLLIATVFEDDKASARFAEAMGFTLEKRNADHSTWVLRAQPSYPLNQSIWGFASNPVNLASEAA